MSSNPIIVARGPTEWMELGAIADAFGVELASHGGGPTNMKMLCAIPNAIYMESGGKQIVNGEVLAPESPGMSSEVSHDFITAYKIG
jgi:L-alanine-DL-glutamate epimerase-like enolase superfamily enzyme